MRKLIAVFLCGFLAACGGGSSQVDLSSYDLPASVDVTFNVLLPENSPAGEAVLFTTLDEVTGLQFNAQSSAMQSSGEHSYTITLSVPAGTLLKYRYTRLGAAGSVDEIGAEQQAILYRAYLVDGPGHVAHDMIATWADMPLEITTGQVSGRVTATGSGQALADMLVVGAGLQTRTDSDGRFVIAGLPQGLHNLVVFAEDGTYLPFQQGALVAAGSDTSASIQLTPNVMANITLLLTPPENHTAGVPVYLIANLSQLTANSQMALQADGRYALNVQLPTGVDIGYKYSLGDGFWNSEHTTDGNFVLRQLIIPAGTTAMTIEDEVTSWASGSTAAIWFDLIAPASDSPAYIQFKLADWGKPLPMWNLGDGHWAYKLYSPTNFAAPLEYRYCLDAACTIQEASGSPRSANGNQETIQIIEDHVDAWQGQ